MTGGGEFQRQGTRCRDTAAHSSRRGRTGGGRPHSTAELSSSSGTHGLSPTPGGSAALRWGGAGGAPGARQKTQPCRVLCFLPFSAEREAAQSRKGWLPGPCPIEWGQRATLQPPTPQPPAEQPSFQPHTALRRSSESQLHAHRSALGPHTASGSREDTSTSLPGNVRKPQPWGTAKAAAADGKAAAREQPFPTA